MNATPLGSLSGGTDGGPVVVAATAIGSGTTIHTATTSTTGFDEITLFVTNIDTVARLLTLGWGGTADASLICKALSIPASSGPIPICTLRLRNGLIVKAAGDAASILNISGFVNRYV